MHGVISLPDATSYDKPFYTESNFHKTVYRIGMINSLWEITNTKYTLQLGQIKNKTVSDNGLENFRYSTLGTHNIFFFSGKDII